MLKTFQFYRQWPVLKKHVCAKLNVHVCASNVKLLFGFEWKIDFQIFSLTISQASLVFCGKSKT